MENFSQKNILVVGAGLSGRALARYFASAGAKVVLTDQRQEQGLADLQSLRDLGVTFDLGGHTESLFLQADLIVVSPGVSLDVPVLRAARQKGVPILGEVEIAWRDLDAPLIGVTGTNGKSTTTSLLGEIFQAWGKEAFVGGNLGTPMIEAVDRKDWDFLVVELSSFQLEALDRFRPKYALLLNLSEDHLDRYPDYNAYIAAKCEIFRNQTVDDWAILNADDPQVVALEDQLQAKIVHFSSQQPLTEGMWRDGGELVWRWQGVEIRFPVADLLLQGRHNVENVMAAMIPALLENCPAEIAWCAACRFNGLPHRMQTVRVVNGVTWINDSKGTNVGSVVKSLAGLPAPVTLIAGGKDKGGDYSPLVSALPGKVSHLVLLGEAAARLEQELCDVESTIHRVETLAEAVSLSALLTPAGGTVLLSPACSSFDMFSSYEERGENFQTLVMDIPARKEGTA
ncbi:MAG: UDP-N-acetylmuramoyl-L-alanine--D-glutamate ligase [Desulfuromonas sp.]|nr:MAG: UDP-N-acetylmuramoyl-L-alanine--D-glutamate ligase [Desulfuromonas sp.]